MKTIIGLLILLIPTLAQAQLAELIKAAAEKQAEQFEALKKSNTENFQPITGAFGVKLGQHISEVKLSNAFFKENKISNTLRYAFLPIDEHRIDGFIGYQIEVDQDSKKVVSITAGSDSLELSNCLSKIEVIRYIISKKYGHYIEKGYETLLPQLDYDIGMACKVSNDGDGYHALVTYSAYNKTVQSQQEYLETASANLKSSGL